MDALELLGNIEQLDIVKVAGEALAECTEEFVNLNREQLLEGLLSTGHEITPSYFEDPFFKTPEAAKRYSDWKDQITPNPKRSKGTPNLFIIGSFHQSISMEVKEGEYEIGSDYKDAESITGKFTENIFGLDEEKRGELIDEKLEEVFFQKSHEELGL
jgi:hypothetical protein